jgi:hypothetical protein
VKKVFLIIAISVFGFWPAPLRSDSTEPTASSCRTTINGDAGVTDGTYPCALKVVFSPADHAMEFTLTLNTTGSGSLIELSVLVDAPETVLQSGTFTLGEGSTTGSTSLKQVAGPARPVWFALKSKTSALTTVQGLQQYLNPKGSLSATMQAQDASGAHGTVALQISFPSVLDE